VYLRYVSRYSDLLVRSDAARVQNWILIGQKMQEMGENFVEDAPCVLEGICSGKCSPNMKKQKRKR